VILTDCGLSSTDFSRINAAIKHEEKILGLASSAIPIKRFLQRFSANAETGTQNMMLSDKGEILIQNGKFHLDQYSGVKSSKLPAAIFSSA
jgi:hypothetical protein